MSAVKAASSSRGLTTAIRKGLLFSKRLIGLKFPDDELLLTNAIIVQHLAVDRPDAARGA